MNVNNAINGLVPPPHFTITEEVTVGKSPIPLNSVGKLSVVPVTFENMSELMLGENLSMQSVWEVRQCFQFSSNPERIHAGEKPCNRGQGAGAFACSTSIRKQEQTQSGENPYDYSVGKPSLPVRIGY